MTKDHILSIARVHIKSPGVNIIYIYQNTYEEDWRISLNKPKVFDYNFRFKEFEVRNVNDIDKISKDI